MKALLCMFAVAVAECLFGMEVPSLPEAIFADAEVSTNFTFAVGCDATWIWRRERECHHQSRRDGLWPDDKVKTRVC